MPGTPQTLPVPPPVSVPTLLNAIRLAASSGGGGSGTVTSVSVTTQNGVSATVTNPTTTPALAFTLGNITPTTVQLSGSVSGTTLLQSPPVAGSAVITFPSVTGTLAITGNTVSQFAAGGTLSSLTGFSLRSTGAAFDLSLATSEVLTANRTLSFNVGNADRTLTIPATGTAALLGTANVFTAAQTINNGTLVASAPALVVGQTWNNAAVTFNGASIGVVNTAAGAASSILTLFGGAAGATARWRFLEDGSLVPGADAVYKIGSQSTPLRPSADLFNVNMANCDISGYLTVGAFVWIGSSAAAKLYGPSANVLQLGVDAAGVSNQRFQSANRITSDGVGANLTIAGGNGRGGAGGTLALSTYDTGAAGTAGVLRSRMTFDTAGAVAFPVVTAVTTETVVSDTTWPVTINGVAYKICLKA